MVDATTIESDLLALQVARLFFERQLPKTEIGQRLGISRFRVARLLDEALARGLVTIDFKDVAPVDADLGQALEERYGLDLCIVVKPASPRSALSSLAHIAAATVDALLSPDEVLGVAWGSTVAAVIDAIRPRQASALKVVQLAGGSTRVTTEHNPSELARRLAARLGASLHALYAPTFVESRSMRDTLLHHPDLRPTVDLFAQVTTAIVGIGALSRGDEGRGAGSALIASGVLSEKEVIDLRNQGAVGDLVLHAFDTRGHFLANDLDDRAVAISAEQLGRVPRVIAVAGGAAKGRAIAGALASGVVRTLITDDRAARAILRRR